MKLFFVMCAILIFSFSINNIFADCNTNTDWPDAPCMDQIINNRFPQHQVDKWAEYYEYKGSGFIESKTIEMNNAIENDRLLEWTDASIQNENVWRYYYFSGQAPNPYPYLEGIEFETIPQVNYVDFRDAKGEIICKGYSSGGRFLEYPECGPINQFAIHVMMIALPVAGIVAGFVVWRKRK